MPPVHRQGDLRACGATTIVSEQMKVFAQGMLVAVEGSMDTHGGGPGGLAGTIGALANASGVSGFGALSSMTGLSTGALSGLPGLSGLSGLSGLTSLEGFTSMAGAMGISLPDMASAMSGLGLNLSGAADIGAIASSVASIGGVDISGAGGVMGSLGAISEAAGGLTNIGSLQGLGSISGIGSMGNYLNAAQGILGLGGSMSMFGGAMNAVNTIGSFGGGGPGSLISASPGKVLVQGKKLIVAMMDQSVPDIMGFIPHIGALPQPIQGAMKVFAYG